MHSRQQSERYTQRMASGFGGSVLLGAMLVVLSVSPVAAQTVPILTPPRNQPAQPQPPRVVVQTLPPRPAATAEPEIAKPETAVQEQATATAVPPTPTIAAPIATAVPTEVRVATPPAILQSTPQPATSTPVGVADPAVSPAPSANEPAAGPIAVLLAIAAGTAGWFALRRRSAS